MEDKLFELREKDGKVLSNLNTYISNLLDRLWEQPKIDVRILENANIKVVKEHLHLYLIIIFMKIYCFLIILKII